MKNIKSRLHIVKPVMWDGVATTRSFGRKKVSFCDIVKICYIEQKSCGDFPTRSVQRPADADINPRPYKLIKMSGLSVRKYGDYSKEKRTQECRESITEKVIYEDDTKRLEMMRFNGDVYR